MPETLILGIESSCDETSAAVVADGRRILSSVVASQVDLHAKFGGVVPEVASRKHVELITPVIEEALQTAGVGLPEINAVAVTNGPGLLGALIVGLCAAKAIAWARSIPLVNVHHIEAHISALYLAYPEIEYPFLCLVVSGAHSDLVKVSDFGRYEILGRTRDDAAGEAFDKGARAMGLGYPGGPIIDRLAKSGNPSAIAFPRATLDKPFDFSFSGLKTAVLRYMREDGEKAPIEDIAASFQQAIVDALVSKLFAAAAAHGIRRVAVAGGVAANSRLKGAIEAQAARSSITAYIPPISLCTDNAAMVAAAGYRRLVRGLISDLGLDAFATRAITAASVP